MKTYKDKHKAWFLQLAVIFTFIAITFLTEQLTWDFARWLYGESSILIRVLVIGAVHWTGPHILVPLIITALCFGWYRAPHKLGLDGSVTKGIGFAFLLTLPLALLYGLTTPLAPTDNLIPQVLNYAIFSPISEEVLFRCFLFGILFRFAGWGFLPAALLGAVIFGAFHLSNGSTLGEAGGIFAITFIAGLWWAWLYVEWGYNAWVPIGFHVMMNFWHTVFDVSDSAIIPMAGEITRALIILISIVITLILKRRGNSRVVKREVWLKGLNKKHT